jgi:hypothetical protein
MILIATFAFFLAGDLHHQGIAPKWGTAITGTLLTFGLVIYAFRSHLLRWSFWISFVLCAGVHVCLMWLFFGHLLGSFSHFSPLLWFPFMLIEIFVLLIVIKRIEEKITGNREIIKL